MFRQKVEISSLFTDELFTAKVPGNNPATFEPSWGHDNSSNYRGVRIREVHFYYISLRETGNKDRIKESSNYRGSNYGGSTGEANSRTA